MVADQYLLWKEVKRSDQKRRQGIVVRQPWRTTKSFGINERITDTGIIGDVMYIICTYNINKISKKNNLDLLSEDGFWICEKEAEAAAVRRGEIQYQLFI